MCTLACYARLDIVYFTYCSMASVMYLKCTMIMIIKHSYYLFVLFTFIRSFLSWFPLPDLSNPPLSSVRSHNLPLSIPAAHLLFPPFFCFPPPTFLPFPLILCFVAPSFLNFPALQLPLSCPSLSLSSFFLVWAAKSNTNQISRTIRPKSSGEEMTSLRDAIWRQVHGRCKAGAWQVQGRCKAGARQVRGRCKAGARQVQCRCKASASQMHGRRITDALQVHHKCMVGASQMHGKCIIWNGRCITNAWQVHLRCMAGASQMHGRCITNAWQVHGRCTTDA